MKNFRKNKQKHFVCEECGKTYIRKSDLSYHISHKHFNIKIYFDKWLKEENDDKCKICNNITQFESFRRGYKHGCCRNHIKNWISFQMQKGVFEKYKIKSTFQIKEVRNKSKETCIIKYKNENYRNDEKIKQTCLEKYGVDNPLKSSEIRKQMKQTMIKRYGSENPQQNREIFNNSLKTRFQLHKYKDTDLTYQGSYELDFLDKFYGKIDIENGPSIKYVANKKNKVYHSDFYIPTKNLIVEIKSSWTLKLDVDIEEKKKATIANGFNYIMIMDKNYCSLISPI